MFSQSKNKYTLSRLALCLSLLTMLATHLYFPKWTFKGTEATISWDVSGYYMYLPALFIYNDLKQCNFRHQAMAKYQFTPFWGQSFVHKESGNMVMKYSCGQAVSYMSFFFMAHLWALFDDAYPADGFSFPYQLLISTGSLFWIVIALIFLRKSLLYYFSEAETALALLGIVLGSNYLNYGAIDGAMTHCSLFMIYSLLIYISIQFYKEPSLAKSVVIGALVGLAALTRPTEIIAWLIPLFWGLNLFNKQAILTRLNLFKRNIKLLIAAILVCGVIGSIQIIYWYYVSGNFLVYSYEDQGFSWLSPHLEEGFFSFKSGWLIYSPFMFFPLIGFWMLYRSKKSLFFACFIFFCLFTYIAFSWDEWWYGVSLDHRAMVQSYSILAFPLAAFFGFVLKTNRALKIAVLAVASLFIYANIWFTHQAHRGGMLYGGQMTNAYYWKTLFTYKKNRDHAKLLDKVSYFHNGGQQDIHIVYEDTSYSKILPSKDGEIVDIKVPIHNLPSSYDWLRISANFSIKQKEWNRWKMTHFAVKLKHHDELIKEQMFRVQRLLNDGESRQLYLDFKQPTKQITSIEINCWAGNSLLETAITNPRIETFDEP